MSSSIDGIKLQLNNIYSGNEIAYFMVAFITFIYYYFVFEPEFAVLGCYSRK